MEIVSRHSSKVPDDPVCASNLQREVYGEIGPAGMRALIENMPAACALDTKSIFVDVGSGKGHLPLFVHVAAPWIRHVYGIEVNQCRHRIAQRRARNVSAIGSRLTYIGKDVLESGFPHGTTHVFSMTTVLDDELLAAVIERARQAGVRCFIELGTMHTRAPIAKWGPAINFVATPVSWQAHMVSHYHLRRSLAAAAGLPRRVHPVAARDGDGGVRMVCTPHGCVSRLGSGSGGYTVGTNQADDKNTVMWKERHNRNPLGSGRLLGSAHASSCVHVPWPSHRPMLRSCAHSAAAAAATGGLDSDLHYMVERGLSSAQNWALGKLTRHQLQSIMNAVGLKRPSCGIACVWPRLSCVLENSRAQQQQDMLLLPVLLRERGGRPGTFVELGALDGVQLSNTFMLERCFNWSGLLIEANPDNFKQLKRSGRQLSNFVHSAICSADTQPPTVRMTIDGGNVAHQVSKMNASAALPLCTTKLEARRAIRCQPPTIDVPCAPLRRLMSEAGLRRQVDFLSLDVEGAELIVLNTIAPSVFKFIMVETELEVSSRHTINAVERLIISDGFSEAIDVSGIQYNKVFRHSASS